MNGAEVLDLTLRRLGMSQAALAEAVGCSQKHVSGIMRGHTGMSAWFVARVEVALDIRGLAEELLVAQARTDAQMAVRVWRAEAVKP